MTGYANMEMNTPNSLGRRLQSRFYERGYGTLADTTRARVLVDRAEQKRNMPPKKKNTRANNRTVTREERVMDAIIKTSGRRIEVKTLETKENTKSYRKKTKLPISAIMMTLIFGMLLAFVVHSSVRINEANAELSDLQAGIALQNAELRALEIELESKNDLRVIEDIAVNELGMIKKENIDKEYITLSEEDCVLLAPEDEQKQEKAPTLLSAFSDRFGQLAEYFR